MKVKLKHPVTSLSPSTSLLDTQGVSSATATTVPLDTPNCELTVLETFPKHPAATFCPWQHTPDASGFSRFVSSPTLHYSWSSYSVTDRGVDGSISAWIPRIHHASTAKFGPPVISFSSELETFCHFPSPLKVSFGAYALLSANNNSATSPTRNPDATSRESPATASVSDRPQPFPASITQPATSSILSNSIPQNSARANMLDEILFTVKCIGSDEPVQPIINNHVVTEAAERQAVCSETSDELASSDVDGPTGSLDTPHVRTRLIKRDGGLSTQSEPEPVSSCVDDFPQCISDRKIRKATLDWAEPEPLSSAVDAIVYSQNQCKIKTGKAALWDSEALDDTVSELLPLSEVLEAPAVPEALSSSSSDFVGPVRHEINNIGPQEVPKNVHVVRDSFKNRIEVTLTGSETSISLHKKESLSEQTGMEISHSELPADAENSESGIPMADMSDAEQKSCFDRSIDSSVPDRERRPKHGIVKSIRQRQSAPADIAEGDQASHEQFTSIEGTQRIEAVSGDSPYLNQQQFHSHDLQTILDAQQTRINDVRVQRMAELRQGRSPYDASFMVMIGLCLTTVFILLNRLYFFVDILYTGIFN